MSSFKLLSLWSYCHVSLILPYFRTRALLSGWGTVGTVGMGWPQSRSRRAAEPQTSCIPTFLIDTGKVSSEPRYEVRGR